jgi:S1-C subfamily serine protease
VAVFGFPLASILSSSGNFTRGDVTALAGVEDDSRFVQISAPVQPGNSGGPLLDASANVIGVVSSKLNALKTMAATQGDIPQNVNFAIKSSIAANFLETNRVQYDVGAPSMPLPATELAERARAISVFVTCQ